MGIGENPVYSIHCYSGTAPVVEDDSSNSDADAQGYSHGSLIASLCPLLDHEESRNVQVSHILLSYPLSPRSLITVFRSDHYAETLSQLVRNPRSKVLVIYSDQDEFTAEDKYDAWTHSLRREAQGGGQLAIVKFQGTNHFWSNLQVRRQLLDCISRWVP